MFLSMRLKGSPGANPVRPEAMSRCTRQTARPFHAGIRSHRDPSTSTRSNLARLHWNSEPRETSAARRDDTVSSLRPSTVHSEQLATPFPITFHDNIRFKLGFLKPFCIVNVFLADNRDAE